MKDCVKGEVFTHPRKFKCAIDSVSLGWSFEVDADEKCRFIPQKWTNRCYERRCGDILWFSVLRSNPDKFGNTRSCFNVRNDLSMKYSPNRSLFIDSQFFLCGKILQEFPTTGDQNTGSIHTYV